ncbi:MAG: hypothetical protein ACREEM_41960, partial [Blastocatellia bacterium]
RRLALSLTLLAMALAVEGGSASERNELHAGAANAPFQRPTGIYAIGLAAQPPPKELLEKPFVDGVALAQEWRTVETAKDTYNFSTIDATLALLDQYKKMTAQPPGDTPTIPGNPLPSATPANGTFTLIWTPSTDADGIASYELQRSSNRGLHFTTIAMPATNSHTETNLAPGKYQYRVRAVDTLGNKSPYSRAAMRGVYSLDSGGGTYRDANIRSHSYVEGYVLRPSWSELETARDVYDFRMIDHVIAKLEPIGKKLSLEIMRPPEPGYIARTPGVTTWEDKDTRYDDDRDPSTPLYRAVPWDPFLLERFERLMKALSDHLAPDASQGGKLAPLRDHPALANLNPALPGTHAAIRNPVPPNSIRVADMPGYTRDAFKNAVLRDLHAAVDNFPNQYVYEGFWDVRDNTASPLLWQAIRDMILAEFDGVKNPRVGFFQENLAASKDLATGLVTGIPNPQVAQALSTSGDSTYIAFQALQGWRNPFNDPAKTANTTPADAMKFAYDNYGATYFEIYVGDLDFAGYAAGFTEWNDRFVDLSAVTVNDQARNVTSASAASFSATQLAPESIVAAFGTGLATAIQAATTIPLPTALAGTSVKLRDSAGTERLAPLFFVSPAQLNYLIPVGTATGVATITVTSGNGAVSVGSAQIAVVAPGLFSANANGQGVAAAIALRVKADGSQSYEPVAQFDAGQNKFVAVPVDLGPDLGNASDQVFLILFGTGLRRHSGLSSVSARIGGPNGVDAQVIFAGAQDGFVGLDQVNARLPRSLIGRGEVDITLMADRQAANTVKVNIK